MIHGRLILVFLGALLLPACDQPSDAAFEPSDFTRFVPGKKKGNGKFDTAIVTYRDKKRREVTLVAAVHVADARYYDELNRDFRGMDALLYELIAEPEDRPRPGEERGGMVSMFQRALKDVLELEFQLEGIDYQAKNFVHADLDPRAFQKLQAERGESLIKIMFKVMLAEWEEAAKGNGSEVTGFELFAALFSKDRASSLKLLLAQELERMEKLVAGIEEGGDGKGSVILTERNKKAIAVLKDELKAGKKRLGIFYGAAHMPDLEERLVALGFERKKHRWLTAWDVKKKVPEEKPGK